MAKVRIHFYNKGDEKKFVAPLKKCQDPTERKIKRRDELRLRKLLRNKEKGRRKKKYFPSEAVSDDYYD